MTEQEVKDSIGIALRKIKNEMIPAMTNVLMDAFQYGLNTGTELGAKIVNDKFDSKTQSCIKWQTGEPKEEGRYLVTTIDGHIATAVMIKDDLHDKYFFNQYVKAWCKLSDIQPYKGKEE